MSWTEGERTQVEEGMRTHPIESGKCAALARLVAAVASGGGRTTSGHQVRPLTGRFIVPKHAAPPCWASHTFARTEDHEVDVLTTGTGTPRALYLETHWEHADFLTVVDVDLLQVDPGIQQA